MVVEVLLQLAQYWRSMSTVVTPHSTRSPHLLVGFTSKYYCRSTVGGGVVVRSTTVLVVVVLVVVVVVWTIYYHILYHHHHIPPPQRAARERRTEKQAATEMDTCWSISNLWLCQRAVVAAYLPAAHRCVLFHHAHNAQPPAQFSSSARSPHHRNPPPADYIR